MTLNLYFETGQESLEKEFDINSTISEVKQEIADEIGAKVSEFSLEYEQDALDDDKTLEELDLSDFSTIQVVFQNYSVQVDLSGKCTKFDLKPTELTQELYKKVAEGNKVSQNQVELYFGGKLLSPSVSFLQAAISSNSVIQAIIKKGEEEKDKKEEKDTKEETKTEKTEKKDQALINVLYPNGDSEKIYLKFSALISDFVSMLSSKVTAPEGKYPRFVLNSFTITDRDDRTFDKFLTDTESPRLSTYTASIFWDYSDGALQ